MVVRFSLYGYYTIKKVFYLETQFDGFVFRVRSRQAEMLALDAAWPGYGFAVHKGYPTRLHLEALARLGPTAVHRRSFGPVRRLLDAEGPPVRSGR